MIGVSKGTLLSWLYQSLLKEPGRAQVAGSNWRVWTEADIERARKLKATMKRGPKPKAGLRFPPSVKER